MYIICVMVETTAGYAGTVQELQQGRCACYVRTYMYVCVHACANLCNHVAARALARTKLRGGGIYRDCDRCFALPHHQLHYSSTFAHRLSGGVVSRLIKGAQGGSAKIKTGHEKPKGGGGGGGGTVTTL